MRLALISVFLLFGLSSSARDLDSTNLKWLEQLFNYRVSEIDGLGEFKDTVEIPEKWKKNSAIILLEYARFFAEGSSNIPRYGVYTQTRVLLNDQYAVNDFSSFTIEPDEWFQVRVIKKDGNVILFDRRRAVTGDVRIYDAKKKIDISFTTEIRIPVPNLEVGDVIEYERFWENISDDPKDKEGRLPFHSRYTRTYLHETFPVLKRVIDIDLRSPYYLKWQSLNSAPELQVRAGNPMYYSYRFMDENRGNIKGEYWSAGNLELPQVKFSIQKAPKRQNARTETGLKAYSKDWFLAMAKEANSDYRNSHSGFYVPYNKSKEDINFKSKRSITDFYTRFRSYYFIQENSPDDEFANYKFIITMARLLKKWNLDYELVMAVPKEFGTIDQVVFPDEIYWAIRLKESDIVLGQFDAFSTINEWQNSVRGTTAYFVDFNGKNKRKGKIYTGQIPVQKELDNGYSYNLGVNLAGNELWVDRVCTYWGLSRFDQMGNMPYFVFDKDYQALYGQDYGMGIVPYFAFMDQKNLQRELENLRDRYWNDQFHLASAYLGMNLQNPYYKVENYELIEIRDGGRELSVPKLIYTDEFYAKGLVSRADSMLVIHMGRLLQSSNTLFDKEDSLRLTGIDFNAPKTVRVIIHFNVTNGYTYEGIEQFDTTISNRTGSYEVHAEANSEGFTLYATRTYSQAYFDKSYWPEIRELEDLTTRINAKHIILIPPPQSDRSDPTSTDK